jgi:hypothetical protein
MVLSYVRSSLLRFVALVAVSVPLLLVFTQVYTVARPALISLRALMAARYAAVVAPARLVVPAPPAPSLLGVSIVGGPSISAEVVNRVLAQAGSPAIGTGQALSDLSAQYRVDDAYALAVFEHESTFGLYGAGNVNHALGNIICAGYPSCNGRFRFYSTWAEGYADFYRLMVDEYLSRGLTTVQAITPVYAPVSENDPASYIASVCASIARFRAM